MVSVLKYTILLLKAHHSMFILSINILDIYIPIAKWVLKKMEKA